MTVTVFSKPDCPQCELTKRDMDILGIDYNLVDISKDLDSLENLMNLGFKSAPVVKADEDYWSGYDQEKIKELAMAM